MAFLLEVPPRLFLRVPEAAYRNSFQGDLNCGDDLLWPRVSLLPLFQSGVNNNTYTQGSATLHPPRRTEVSCAFGAEDPTSS